MKRAVELCRTGGLVPDKESIELRSDVFYGKDIPKREYLKKK